jgi:hypothetical protein
MNEVQAPAIEEALQAARAAVGKSNTARLREIFPSVEQTLKSGVKRELVLQILNEQGFELSMTGFKSALQRIRKEERAK